jgi:hypothetical protein
MIGMRRQWGLAEALGDLCPGAQWLIRDNDWNQLEWFNDSFVKPTLAQIQARQVELEAAEPMRVLREIRDWYLRESDWTQVADLRQIRGPEWCAAWDSYRQELRNFPNTVTNVQFDEFNFLSGVTWPQMPNLK